MTEPWPGPAPEPPSDLTLTIRVHDKKEKKDPTMSACWAVIHLDRKSIGSSAEELAKKLIPLLKQIKNLKLT